MKLAFAKIVHWNSQLVSSLRVEIPAVERNGAKMNAGQQLDGREKIHDRIFGDRSQQLQSSTLARLHSITGVVVPAIDNKIGELIHQ